MAVEDALEEWLPVEEAPGYKVSNLGNVMGRRGKPLTQTINQFGYKTVSPYVGGKTLYRQVHRLVALAFIPNPGGLPLVNHVDGGRLNNCASNLEWVTAKQNAARTINHATESARRARKVVQTFPDGHTEIWGSLKEAAEEARVSVFAMSAYCRSRRPDARGNTWAFPEDVEEPPAGEAWGKAQGVEVSSHGRIRLPSGQIIVGRKRGNYLRYQSHGVHRLVAEAFCERPPAAGVVNHKNGNAEDNRAVNLEWVSQRENCVHANETGLCRRFPVRRFLPSGRVVDYASIQEASRQTHISAGDITWACKGRKPRAGGSRWEYLNPEGPENPGALTAEAQLGTPTDSVAEGLEPKAGAILDESFPGPPKITDAELAALLAELGL